MIDFRTAVAAQRRASAIAASARSQDTIDFAKALASEHRIAILPDAGADSLSFGILPDGQTVSVAYTGDSADGDPVVRVTGNALGGKFDFICHIKDIDLQNASYAELFALSEHQKHTGGISSVQNLLRPYQNGAVSGDITQKRSDWARLPAFPLPGISDMGLFGDTASGSDLLQMLQSSMLGRLQGSNLFDASDMLSILGSLPYNRYGL